MASTTPRRATVGQGIRLSTQSQMIVFSVYSYFKKLHVKGKSSGPLKRTIEATGEALKTSIDYTHIMYLK